MRTIHRIGLLFWKNLTLRKRHYVVTTLEILLPTIFAILMAYVRTKMEANPVDSDYDGQPNGATYFTEYSEEV